MKAGYRSKPLLKNIDIKGIISSLNKDIPVSLEYGLFSDYQIFEYDKYVLNELYEKTPQSNGGHMVTVTEVVIDEIAGKTMLTIAS